MDSNAGMVGDFPKASIGNYKGVMLCNRPNEFGQAKKPEISGNLPFKNRVKVIEPLGWTVPQKLVQKVRRIKPINGVL